MEDVMDPVSYGFDWTCQIGRKGVGVDCITHVAIFLVGDF